MSQQPQSESPTPHALGTSSVTQFSTDGLPEWCSNEFRERYRRGEVPQFGCYDPVYIRQVFRRTGESYDLLSSSSSSFFTPVSSLVRRCAAERDAASSTSAKAKAEGEEDAQDELDGPSFGCARPAYSWEHITSAEDLWSGPPLTMKIPPAADYERILLDRA
ncbi:hypothetical protein ABL78_1362 [Leptomonas seymouri]|uniref:Uncharacterized protein n=1 Tax=Leptomonas seymouri TaxID=5684 RepID=A0A0N0P835_LEPSE|nr:hypothetical protein ABL78_1362 [Leptomonas seymouri]|eukprot:KPI89486.1 hypothetical protein ABL78_1362 [Leptomonas seymouri]